MPRKAKTENIEGENTVLVGIRVPSDLVKRLDKYVAENGTNRTIETIRGIEFLVSSLECPFCHTLNSGDSVICSVCGSPLDKYKEIMDSILLDYEVISDNIDKVNKDLSKSYDKFDKLLWLFEREEPLVKTKIEDIISKYVNRYMEMTKGISKELRFKDERITKGKSVSKINDEIPGSDYEIDNLCISAYLSKHNEESSKPYGMIDNMPYKLLLKVDIANKNEILELKVFEESIDLGNNILNIIESLIDDNLQKIRDEVKSKGKNKL